MNRDFAKDREVCAAATLNAFILAAREGWPAALDRIAELDAEIEKMREQLVKRTFKMDEVAKQNAVLRQALDDVVSELIANNRVGFENGQVCGLVSEEVENKAVNALATTPAQATEWVQGLVAALRDIAADIKTIEDGIPLPTVSALTASDALAKFEGGGK